MDYLGFWKIKKVMMLGDDDEDPWKTIEQALESDSIDDDTKKFLTDRFMFSEDGTVKVLEPFKEGVTQQDIDEAVAAGIIEVYDNLLVAGLYHWKEEGGKVFVDSGFGGGEPDWGEVTETDGMLNFLTYKLVRE
ncbi:MAG: hypothetical protein IJ856_03125 [Candidatus Methanomethylophilaceae archaeon]|nr:hypothetical protein [Candidatus Methanomethylophilaceae archaeon]